ncbi:uncharacterized protein MELLADRAFT_115407 [Melampsora larici-populina 98AG31]|uniref:Uncharacterized protein n=1 Tax=Melampsora larici-populina (strain 98AG31 / pathotype 3-4-7) TaxID=747676 RepID=F4RA87_MELLP|nr:uncharacterized protein MELLADRAFT_115407 [Melampsora larici-populina 98AG31]EGG10435.1 hypothetical protein MELLADRAFT_115407 [Melampsora larici-populina 98AG31]
MKSFQKLLKNNKINKGKHKASSSDQQQQASLSEPDRTQHSDLTNTDTDTDTNQDISDELNPSSEVLQGIPENGQSFPQSSTPGRNRQISETLSSITNESRPASRASRLSHGRGPIMPDSDDESLDNHNQQAHSETRLFTPFRTNSNSRSRIYSAMKSPDAGTQRSIIYRSTSTLLTHCSDDSSIRRRAVSSRTKRFCVAFSLFTVALAFLLFAIVHIWIGNLVSQQLKSTDSPLDMIKRGIVISKEPDHVAISGIEENTITLSLAFRMGLDVRQSLGWEHKDMRDANVWQRVESRLAKWFVNTSQNARVIISKPVQIRPLYYSIDQNFTSQLDLSEDKMIEVDLPPFDMPIGYPVEKSTEVSIDEIAKLVRFQLPIKITSSETLKKTLMSAWEDRRVNLAISVADVHVQIEYDRFPSMFHSLLRKRANHDIKSIYKTVTVNVPELPPILENPTQLVHIDGYSFFPLASTADPDDPTRLGIRATASIPNPLSQSRYLSHLDLNMDVPWQFPLQVFLKLPSESEPESIALSNSDTTLSKTNGVLMASVMTVPFRVNQSEERLSLTIEGSLVKQIEDGNATVQSLSGPLSEFLDRFLKGLSTNVSIRYDKGRIEHDNTAHLSNQPVSIHAAYPQTQLILGDNDDDNKDPLPSNSPPPFLESLLAPLDVLLPFPGTTETQILQNITIKDMSFSLSGTTMICSGLVHGVLALPAEMSGLSDMLNITEIFPEVIVFDGDLPSDEDHLIEGGLEEITSRPILFFDQQINRLFSSKRYLIKRNEGKVVNQKDDKGPPTPEPYPTNAFAKLVPPNYIPSQLIQEPSPDNPTKNLTILIAELKDVPLTILPGQGDVFRRYAAKWLFNRGQEGLKTSVRGESDARAIINGFGSINLTGLPVQGTFFVGAKT